MISPPHQQSYPLFFNISLMISVLHSPSEGGPYNRLILQTESGEAWESNEDQLDASTTASAADSSTSTMDGDREINICKLSLPSEDHLNSCHTLLFLKDQASMDAKLKNEMRYSCNADLTKMRVIAPEFPKYTPQLYGLP